MSGARWCGACGAGELYCECVDVACAVCGSTQLRAYSMRVVCGLVVCSKASCGDDAKRLYHAPVREALQLPHPDSLLAVRPPKGKRRRV